MLLDAPIINPVDSKSKTETLGNGIPRLATDMRGDN